MHHRPEVVAFDVVETLFSLESLRPRLVEVGLAAHDLETWFAQMLRDAFALGATGKYLPFRDVAGSALDVLLPGTPDNRSDKTDHMLDGFVELDAEADVAPAMTLLRDRGIPIIALTNGSEAVTRTLLERAGLTRFVSKVISVDDIGYWKPHRDVYQHCAKVAEVAPDRLGLIAAHGWDIHGANRAGLVTGFVGRDGARFPVAMDRPDVEGTTLVDVVERLLDPRD